MGKMQEIRFQRGAERWSVYDGEEMLFHYIAVML